MRINFNDTALSESKLGRITPIQNLSKKFIPNHKDESGNQIQKRKFKDKDKDKNNNLNTSKSNPDFNSIKEKKDLPIKKLKSQDKLELVKTNDLAKAQITRPKTQGVSTRNKINLNEEENDKNILKSPKKTQKVSNDPSNDNKLRSSSRINISVDKSVNKSKNKIEKNDNNINRLSTSKKKINKDNSIILNKLEIDNQKLLNDKFNKAEVLVNKLNCDENLKREFYALSRQAKEGDNKDPKPGMFSMFSTDMQDWQAYENLKGINEVEAKNQ